VAVQPAEHVEQLEPRTVVLFEAAAGRGDRGDVLRLQRGLVPGVEVDVLDADGCGNERAPHHVGPFVSQDDAPERHRVAQDMTPR
jgi:hypothetical protein